MRRISKCTVCICGIVYYVVRMLTMWLTSCTILEHSTLCLYIVCACIISSVFNDPERCVR